MTDEPELDKTTPPPKKAGVNPATTKKESDAKGPPEFADTRHEGPPEFADTRLEGPPELADTQLEGPPELADTQLEGPPELADTQLEGPPELADTQLEGPPELADTHVEEPGEPESPKPTPSSEPERFGDFVVERELARGGMGVVYVARNTTLDRAVALKVLLAGENATPELLARFAIEARATARLRHPNIVGIHQVGEERGLAYFAMDLIEGCSLRDHIREQGQLAPREAARIARELAGALQHAHSKDVLHRDIKPANVLLTEQLEPLLTDFGLAKDISEEASGLTQSGQLMGTPSYMPPEQALGDLAKVGRRADVYSLGAVLYEMLTGRPPFTGPTLLKVLAAVLDQDPTPPRTLRKGLSADLETICLKCLEKSPEDRYASAAELNADLDHYLRDEPIRASPPGVLTRLRKWTHRRPALSRALAWSVVLVALALGFSSDSFLRAETANLALAEEDHTSRSQSLQRLAAEQAKAEEEELRRKAEAEHAKAEAERREAERKQTLLEAEAKIQSASVLHQEGLLALETRRWGAAAVYLAHALERQSDPKRRGLALKALSNVPNFIDLPVGSERESPRHLAWSIDGALLALATGSDVTVLETVHWKVQATLKRLGRGSFSPGSILWAPDGSGRLAICDETKIRIVRGKTLEPVRTLEHPGRFGLRAIAWSFDGTLLASSGSEDVIRVWNARTGEELAKLSDRARGVLLWSPRGRRLITLHKNTLTAWTEDGEITYPKGKDPWTAPLKSVSWRPDGTHIAAAIGKRIALWRSAKTPKPPTEHDAPFPLETISWSPGGTCLVGTNNFFRKGQRWSWDPKYQGTLRMAGDMDFSAGRRPYLRVCWSPDGARFALSKPGLDCVEIWHESTRLLTELPGNAESLAFSPDGRRLSGVRASERQLRVWDLGSGPFTSLPVTRSHVPILSWSGAGLLLSVVGMNRRDTHGVVLNVWEGGARLESIDSPRIPSVGWAPGGSQLVFYDPDGLHFRDPRTGETRRELKVAEKGVRVGSVYRHSWSHDRKRIAAGCFDGRVRMLDADSGAVIATLDTKPSGSFSSVSGVSWSPDDSRLVVWSGSGHMRMFRTDPLEPGTEPVEPLALLTEGKLELFRLGVAWSADGRRLIGEASERPQRCSLWSGETGKRLKTWEARGNVSFADRQPLWSHDSSRWARIAANGAVHVHDPNGETLVEIPTKGVEVHRFAWATDGLRLATVGGWPGPAALWDGVTGERIADLEGGAERLAFSPDGLLVATASARAGQAGDTENPVRLYDARSGALLVVLPGHQGAIMSLAWSADSGTVATASSHWLEPLRTWDVKTILAEPKALVVLAERRAHLRLAPSGKLEPSTPR